MDGFTLNLSWKRLISLGVLLAVYFLLGGFTPPDMSDSGLAQRGMDRAWFYMLTLFCAGAISATVIDHEYGLFPPASIRPLYIILGVILMGAALIWMHSLGQN